MYQPAPPHPQEEERLAELLSLAILDTPPEERYDRLVQLIARICDVPIALVSIVDARRQWFKASVGLDACETGRDEAFCAHAILSPQQLLIVPDALADPRFRDNPLVTGPPHVRFYAGAPIVLSSGLPVGTLCAIDRRPREPWPWQLQSLALLARRVGRLLEEGRDGAGLSA